MQTATRTTNPETTRGTGRNTSRPQKRQDTGPRIRPLGDLLNNDTIKPRQQLCGPWLLERGFAMVFAPTGVGKSWFAMGVAAAVAGGGTFGHWSSPEPKRVLYIDGEMDMSDLKSRFQSIVGAADGDRDQIAGNVFLYARHDQPESAPMPDFGREDHGDYIVQRVREIRPHLVVLDNLSTLATVDDDNAADAWDPFLKILHRIKGAGASVLVVHHANKGGTEYRGSSKIPVMFDALVRLQPDTQAHGINGATFLLDFTKTRMLTEDAGKTFNVAFADQQWLWDVLVSPELQSLVRRILDGEFRTQQDAARAIGRSKGEVSKMLAKAYAAGVTTREKVRAAFQSSRDEADEAAADDHNDF